MINRFLIVLLLTLLSTINLHATVLFTSGWERPGQATSGCAIGSEGTCFDHVWTVMNYDTSTDTLEDDNWRNYRADQTADCDDGTECDRPLNPRTQSTEKVGGSYALEIDYSPSWPVGGAGTDQAEWTLEINNIDTNWTDLEDVMIDEYYTSHWVKFSTGFKFPHRLKGIRWYSDNTVAGSMNTCGNLSAGVCGKRGESVNGYGSNNSDNTEKKALFDTNLPGNSYGLVLISNYAAYSANFESDGTSNACGQSDDNSTWGMNTPEGSTIDMFGPADNGTTTDNYWPGCVEEYIVIEPGTWYQIIEHRKIHDTAGVIELWMREGVDGTLKKVIKLDKDAWNGTAYAVSVYDTRCITPGDSVLQIYRMNFYAYMNEFWAGYDTQITQSITVGQDMWIDDFIIATTFAEVKNYGLGSVSTTISNTGTGPTITNSGTPITVGN